MDAEKKLKYELGVKGMVTILLALGGFRDRFSEISGVVDISESTLSKRLSEGIEQNLWYKEYIDEGEERDWVKYALTEKGKIYYDIAEEQDLPEAWSDLRGAEFQYKVKKDLFFNEFMQNPERIPPIDDVCDS